jgi:monoamine oxidase
MDQTVDVAIVGGGLSGLAAGRALTRAGKTFVILEASDRTGGRIQNGSVGGAVCELGGEWVAPFQKHIQVLLKELEVETFETYTTGKNTFVYEGKVTHYDPPLPPLPIEAIAELAATMAQFDEMAAKVPIKAP